MNASSNNKRRSNLVKAAIIGFSIVNAYQYGSLALSSYHQKSLFMQPHGHTIQDEFKRTAHAIAERPELRNDGFTKDKGWDCFDGSEIKSHLPEQYAELAKTQVGKDALKYIQETNPSVCVAPDEVYEAAHPHSDAYYAHNYNGLFFKRSTLDASIIVHEKHHGVEYAQTNGYPAQAGKDGKLTETMQACLLLEAGSVAREVILAFQEKENGNPELFRKFYNEGPNGTWGSLVRVINDLIKKNPDARKYFKKPVSAAPDFVMDTLCASFLRGRDIGKNTVSKPGMSSWFQYYTNAWTARYADKASQMNFATKMFDNKLVLGLTGNADYPEGTQFPKTVAAINDLGEQMAPLVKKAVSNNMSKKQVEEMTKTFIKSLQQMPQRYQTASQAGKWQGTPNAMPKAKL